jgi:23S rRNA (adenine2030-N6)-methyltransferase
MLSYQHGFHAGGFADVLKHTVLGLLLEYMTQKDKPLFYLETHAGRGLYDLKSLFSDKTKEYQVGINKIWSHRKTLPQVFAPYLSVCELLNPDGILRYYPGSPSLAIASLRPIDRLYCCELHPQEYTALTHLSKCGQRVHYAHLDGVAQLRALLPPPERRGLIFIDPSFEMKREYQSIPLALGSAYDQFKTGVYALWYPILDERQHQQWVADLLKIGGSALQIEWFLKETLSFGMVHCGLWILNPPFCLHEQMKTVFATLTQYFDSEFFLKAHS